MFYSVPVTRVANIGNKDIIFTEHVPEPAAGYIIVINRGPVDSRVIRTSTLGLQPSGFGSYYSTIDLAPVYNYHMYILYIFHSSTLNIDKYCTQGRYISRGRRPR